MADFDAVVVGAGCAGSAAAFELARAGKSVLVVERGTSAGAKNMSGGRIYSHILKLLYPKFEETAPVERRITAERISLMAPASNCTIDYRSDAFLQEGRDSYSVLRASFDKWLADEAEAQGAEFVYGIPVESLLKDGSRVTGVVAGDDEITAEVVILADGVNSLLSNQATGAPRPQPTQMAVGIKQTIELPSGVIEDRLLLSEGEGAAWLFAGDATKGTVGGGFMYTNRESLSLGLVTTISHLGAGATPIYQMMEDFKQRPDVAALVKGGKVVEHSGHMVPEGGFAMVPEVTGDGVLICGDAAMLVINLGYMVRGMDFAVASGFYAACAACQALEAGDTSKVGLAPYRAALESSFVLQDMKTFRRFPHFMDSTPRIFEGYPEMVGAIMDKMFVVDGQPVAPLKKSLLPEVKKIGYGTIIKDLRGAMKAL